MTYIEPIGFAAALLTTLSFVQQAYKVYQTRQTGDLSLGMFLLFALGVFLWFIYGLLLKSFPIILANFITLLLTSYILFMKIKNG